VPELDTEASLAERDFPDLVQLLQEHRWSGTLWLHRGSVGKNIIVENGRLVFAGSSDPDERLGELLLRKGRVSLRQLVDAGDRVAPGKRLGTILVEDGVLTPKDLVRSVVEHTQEIIYAAFGWAEGHYRLEAGQRPPEAITLNIDTPRLIIEGIRRIESWRRIAHAVGGLEVVYRKRAGHEAIVERLELDPAHAALVDALERPKSLEELCASSSLSSFEVCRSLWALRVIGLVERGAKPPAPDIVDDEGLASVLTEE
jgi:hypothetical protein